MTNAEYLRDTGAAELPRFLRISYATSLELSRFLSAWTSKEKGVVNSSSSDVFCGTSEKVEGRGRIFLLNSKRMLRGKKFYNCLTVRRLNNYVRIVIWQVHIDI